MLPDVREGPQEPLDVLARILGPDVQDVLAVFAQAVPIENFEDTAEALVQQIGRDVEQVRTQTGEADPSLGAPGKASGA